MWHGRAPIPTKTMRLRRLWVERGVGWCCFTCRATQSLAQSPIEMLWGDFRGEVSHCELFPSVKALIAAAYDFFERYNRCPWRTLSVIGSDPAEIT